MTVIGTLIGGRFRLEEEVGTGGMSTVYRAFDPTLERQVAIKLMHRDISNDADQLERFRREARAVAQLNHPHVVTVIDAGEDDGNPYIVFEYVEGETLKDRIRRLGRLPVAEAVAYAVEIARGARARPRAPARPPRRQAPERPDRPRGPREGHRLRHRALARGAGPDRHRPRARHHRLRLPRAGARPRGDRAVRHLLARDRALRDAHRRAPFQARDPGRRGDEARARAAAGRAAPPPRDLGRARRGRRARDREGDDEPLRHDRRDGRTTSRRCWRSRPPARGQRPARQPPCCARCPATPPTSRRCACATRRRALAHRAARHRRSAAIAGFLRHAHREGRRAGAARAPGQVARSPAATPPTTTTPRATTTSRAAEGRSRSTATPTTAWDTETYQGGFEASNKPGVGPLRERRQAVARAPDGRDQPDPGLQGGDLRAPNGRPRRTSAAGSKVSTANTVKREQSIPARHGGQALPLLPALDHGAAARARRSTVPREPRAER